MAEQDTAIALQIKWQGIQLSIHAAGMPYSPDSMNDIMLQANRGWKQLLKDTSEYEAVPDDDEIDRLDTSLSALQSLLSGSGDEECECDECSGDNEENHSGDEWGGE